MSDDIIFIGPDDNEVILVEDQDTTEVIVVGSANPQTVVVEVAEGIPVRESSIQINMTGEGGGDIATGNAGIVELPYNCVPVGVTMLEVENNVGSIVVDIRKSSYASYPTEASVCAAAKPTIVADLKYQDNVLTGWDTNWQAGDILRFVVESNTNMKEISLSIRVIKY